MNLNYHKASDTVETNLDKYMKGFVAGEFGHSEEQIKKITGREKSFIAYLYNWKKKNKMLNSDIKFLPDKAYSSAVKGLLENSAMRDFLGTSL